MNGDYLAPNPWLSAALQPAQQAYQTGTVPTIDSEFARAGRFGSGGQGNAQEQARAGYADSLNRVAYQNYGDERQRQMATLGMAPQLESMRYQPGQMMLGAGQVQDQYNQSLVNDDVNRWNYYQQEPGNRLSQYMQLASGNGGGQQSSQSGGGNPFAGALGGGLQGAAMGGMLGGPWGAAGGAGLGLLLGGLGGR
jgi:hypothetical protein